MPHRLFRLITRWTLPAAPERAWAVLADPGFTWQEWWPAMTAEAFDVVVGPDGFGAPGSWVRMRVRSPLGGAMRIRLYLLEARAPSPDRDGRAKLQVSGDLRGVATVRVARRDGTPRDSARPGGRAQQDGRAGLAGRPGEGCEVRLTWVVTARRGATGLAARCAPRLCEWAHARVMSDGERGLRRHLAR